MKLKPILAASLCLASLLQAQSPRSTVQIDAAAPGNHVAPSVSTDGNLTAAIFNIVSAPHQIHVVTSDGRGLDWTAPVRIDDDAIGSTKLSGPLIGTATKNLHVDGDNIYAVWRDNRNAVSATKTDVYFTRSTDRGVNWDFNTRIDVGVAPGVGDVRDWIMEVSGNFVYVLVSVDPDDASDEELYLATSLDAGATFLPGVSVTPVNGMGIDIEDIGLEADGATVYVSWADDRGFPGSLDDVYITVSADAGQTFAGDIQVNTSAIGVGDAENTAQVSSDANVVFVVWEEELASASIEELRGAVSVDGGVTFGADFQIGAYTAGAADTDLPWSDIIGGVLVVTWEDNRAGSDEVYVAVSSDNGATWTETKLSTNGQFPRIVGAEQDGADVNMGVAYTTSGGSGVAELAISRDGGLSWSTELPMSASTADVDNSEVAYNVLYDNWISVFIANDSGVNNAFSGGVRSQTATLQSDVSGAPTSFAFTGWEPGTPRFVWLLASNSPGSLPLPFGDGRDLGLTFDSTFQATFNDTGNFLTTLDATGSGSTPTFGLNLPAGTTFYTSSLSFDLGPVTIAEISDVNEHTTQ